MRIVQKGLIVCNGGCKKLAEAGRIVDIREYWVCNANNICQGHSRV